MINKLYLILAKGQCRSHGSVMWVQGRTDISKMVVTIWQTYVCKEAYMFVVCDVTSFSILEYLYLPQ